MFKQIAFTFFPQLSPIAAPTVLYEAALCGDRVDTWISHFKSFVAHGLKKTLNETMESNTFHHAIQMDWAPEQQNCILYDKGTDS